ncbi:MAG: 3-oxoadipate enol-lactonase [Verrucomicrobiales bacterium]|jgi:3-oxoadipate enol-lactonase
MYDLWVQRQPLSDSDNVRAAEGPELVLVHSLLTDSTAYDLAAPMLAQNRRVIRVSLPGFGTTPPLDIAEPTIFDLADVVAAALDDEGVSSDATVLGNGLGAFVVVALAIAHGDRFGDLIVANGGASFPPERLGAFTTMSDLVSESGMEAVVDVAVKRIFTDDYLSSHRTAIDERRAVLVKTDPTAFAAACRALRDMDLRGQVTKIKNRTLVIAGGADGTTPPEMAHDLAALIPGAEIVELEGCGHCPPLEQPAEFVQAVEDFLGRTSQ